MRMGPLGPTALRGPVSHGKVVPIRAFLNEAPEGGDVQKKPAGLHLVLSCVAVLEYCFWKKNYILTISFEALFEYGFCKKN